MRCYCSKISSLQKDIDTLSGLKSQISTLKADNNSLTTALSTLASASSEAVSKLSNIGDITSLQRRLNTSAVDMIGNIERTCSSLLNSLSSDKDYYSGLDKQYHDYILEQQEKARAEAEAQHKQNYI